ncbi:MAG: hypothetical protein E2O56_03100 [Gammaproteobacteria bacterium]|nr:MAG: hypothetical protein E2O56_03100 [Gammaproteobacteria bacterium]
MKRDVYDIQGYAIVLDKVIHVTRVFESENNEGFQFNIRLSGEARLTLKHPDLAEATLQRDLFIKALRSDE